MTFEFSRLAHCQLKWISERDLYFMELLINGDKINLPAIMICQMKEAVRKVKACLPYGMVLSLFFQSANIDLTGEDSKTLLHTDTYTAKTLQKMGYLLSKGTWKKKSDASIIKK